MPDKTTIVIVLFFGICLGYILGLFQQTMQAEYRKSIQWEVQK